VGTDRPRRGSEAGKEAKRKNKSRDIQQEKARKREMQQGGREDE
jgi:hypothetical protein